VVSGHEAASADLALRRSGDLPLRCGRQARVRGDARDELLVLRELAVGDRSAAVGRDDPAAFGSKLPAVDLPALRGRLEKRLARSGRGPSELRAHRRSRSAAEGAHVVRHAVRVSHHELDRIHGNTQLFGDLLREGRADVLTHLDLAGEDGHTSVAADVDPGIHRLRQISGASRTSGFLGPRCGRGRGCTNQNAASQELKEAAPVDVEPVQTAFDLVLSELEREAGIDFGPHRGPALFLPAARATAARIRG
jgi:hypothetical protein